MTEREQAVIKAIRDEVAYREGLEWPHYRVWSGVSANEVAHRMGIPGAHRNGNGAVKGSWSGYMSPALRVAPTLRSMVRKGLLSASDDGRRAIYWELGTVYGPIEPRHARPTRTP